MNISAHELETMSAKAAVEALLTMAPRDAASLLDQLPEHQEKKIRDILFDEHYRFYVEMDMSELVDGFNKRMLEKAEREPKKNK